LDTRVSSQRFTLFIMNLEVASVPELIGTNYLLGREICLIFLGVNNLWHIVNGDSRPTIDAK
jgi:hypothetical protein